MIVNYKLVNLLTLDSIVLKPGINRNIDATAFAVATESYPRLKAMIAEGLVEVIDTGKPAAPSVDGGKEPAPAEDENILAKLSVAKAVEVVNNTFDIDALHEMAEHEKRAGVVKALKAQIKKVEDGMKAPEKKDDAEPSSDNDGQPQG